jgi:N-acetyl-gamma-glutamyl-phosphate reductase
MKACIIGSTGYAGQLLSTLLANHPEVNEVYLGSHGSSQKSMTDIYAYANRILPHVLIHSDALLTEDFLRTEHIDVLFFALPHGLCAEWIQKITSFDLNIKIIDLGADLRLKNQIQYEEWYGVHPHPNLLKHSVYGLSELYAADIKNASLIANPGCYATATLLGAVPAIQLGLIGNTPLVVDAKSGISGAGRGASTANLYAETSENLRPYQIGTHRHTPEIEQELERHSTLNKPCQIMFSPSVVPMTRGMISAVYAPLQKTCSLKQLKAHYHDIYSNAPFIRLIDEAPTTKAVRGSNYADLWVHIDERTNTFVVMTAIDNLMKGASGQAVQNMNLMFGFKETLGLNQVPLYP